MPSRKGSRKYHGGMAPVDYVNKEPMLLSLAQGNDFAKHHQGQHGGMAPYPGGVVRSMLPENLADSARVSSTLAAYKEISGLQDGGRKNRKSRKYNGGALVPWGGRRKGRNSRKNRRNSRKNRRNSRKNRRNSRKSHNSRKNRRNSRKNRRSCGQYGGAGYNFAVDGPMLVPESSKMLIPSSLSQQAGLHKEWADAANPSSMMPK
jgi:hypothetical protein